MTTVSAPVVEAVGQIDPVSGLPEILVTVLNTQAFNLVGEDDGSFEHGIGSAVPTNCVIETTTDQADDGTHSLLMRCIATGPGAMWVTLGPYPIAPNTQITAMVAYLANFIGRDCETEVLFYDNTNTEVGFASSGPSHEGAGWEYLRCSVVSPSTATHMFIRPVVLAPSGALDIPSGVTVTPVGTPGTTTWSYILSGRSHYGTTLPSAPGQTVIGPAVLNGTNYLEINATVDAGTGTVDVYRSQPSTCQSIANDFATCADLLAVFPTCADLFSIIVDYVLVATDTFLPWADQGAVAGTQTPPTEDTSGEIHYIDEVGLFLGFVNDWFMTPPGTIKVLRNGSDYVLGASPLYPLPLGVNAASAAVIDRTAPYGEISSYTAVLTALIGDTFEDSPSSIPVAALMGQAPASHDLYDRIGWARDEDASGLLLKWLAGIGNMVQQLLSLSADSYDLEGEVAPGWSQVLDIERAPTVALPWLAQFVGVRFPDSFRDDEMRYAIRSETGFSRGTPASILAAVNKHLLPTFEATLVERDTSPYHLSINVPAAGVVGPATCLSIALGFTHCSDLPPHFATCADLWSSPAQITADLLAAIPAGLVAAINYV